MHLFELSKTTRFTTTKFRLIYRTSKNDPSCETGRVFIIFYVLLVSKISLLLQ